MKPYEEILHELPETFARQQFMTAVSELTAYSYSHAQTLLDTAIHEQAITRVSRGEYKKVNQPQFEFQQ